MESVLVPEQREGEVVGRDGAAPADHSHTGPSTLRAATAPCSPPRPQRPMLRPRPQRIALRTADDYPITGLRYSPSGTVSANVVVAGAVGVPQRFYRRFAEAAVANGFAILTLDYRGIGLSAPQSLKNFHMDYFDWGRFDLAAGVAAMAHADVPLYVVGHSFGGHHFGLLPNSRCVNAFYTFGTGSGWHGWMPRLERIRVLALWHLLGPVLTRWMGYLPWSLLRMGEDLPLAFYRRWKHWCAYPDYFLNDPSVQHIVRGFRRVHAPLMAANSIDDRWALPASRDAFIVAYANAQRETLDIDPSKLGMPVIGHMGYFNRHAIPLWESAFAWLASFRDRRCGRVHDTAVEAAQAAVAGETAKPRHRWLARLAASGFGT